jgi:hypothetical protein
MMNAMPMMAGGMTPANAGGMPMMMPAMMPMSMGMGGMMPGGMMPMPMGGMMPSMGMMPGMMPMPMPGMMPMGGMMPSMGMPMMAMPMMCRMTVEMTKDGMVCRMEPMDQASMEMMTERCNAMNAMMAMGMPAMMTCAGMPMMVSAPK